MFTSVLSTESRSVSADIAKFASPQPFAELVVKGEADAQFMHSLNTTREGDEMYEVEQERAEAEKAQHRKNSASGQMSAYYTMPGSCEELVEMLHSASPSFDYLLASFLAAKQRLLFLS